MVILSPRVWGVKIWVVTRFITTSLSAKILGDRYHPDEKVKRMESFLLAWRTSISSWLSGFSPFTWRMWMFYTRWWTCFSSLNIHAHSGKTCLNVFSFFDKLKFCHQIYRANYHVLCADAQYITLGERRKFRRTNICHQLIHSHDVTFCVKLI